jgi:hypothetical protein
VSVALAKPYKTNLLYVKCMIILFTARHSRKYYDCSKLATACYIICGVVSVALAKPRDPIRPEFPRSLGLMGFKELCPDVPKHMVLDAKCFCQVLKIRHLTIGTSILTLPWYKKTLVGVGQPSASHYWEGTDEEEEEGV